MAICERCWAEAALRAQDDLLCQFDRLLCQVDHYRAVMREREAAGLECSPAEQCGDRHDLVELRDGMMRCRCGARTEVDDE